MRYSEMSEPPRPRVRFAANNTRVTVYGGPGRVRGDDIEHLLRAVLWRLSAGDDPEELVRWAQWVKRHTPQPIRWGSGDPLTAPVGEVLEVG